jgi:hypothetical protein
VVVLAAAVRALERVLTEVARVRLHGFTEREFSKAIKTLQVWQQQQQQQA